jgi:RimJ/RimL family protein N-acetyltransferase
MGFRFFSHCQGKGYATESALALKTFVKEELGAKKLKSRCFKQNIPSANLISRIGLKKVHEDQTHFYFETEL